MADNKKVYQIEINGVKESVSAVESLNKALSELDNRIKELEKSSIKLNAVSSTSTASGGSGASNKASLSEEEKLARQIAQIDAKREAYSKEIYQNYLAAKDVLKNTVNDQKQIAALERLQSDSYSNTMAGMKQKLADIKEAMQTVDLGDTDRFKKLTDDANELNEALKRIEESYGQFGRNVGNYKSAFDGLEKVTVTINGMSQEFNSLRQASRALSNAMGALEANGKKDTKMYKEMERELERVSKAQLRLNSAMNDAKASSKTMDDFLDTMESFAALGQVTQGFSTMFGIDDSEIEKQIAKLLALQNVLKGIEKLRQQMNTQEGFGKIFSNASKGVDQFVAKLAGADYRMGKIVGSTRSASVALQVFSNVLKGGGSVAATVGLMALIGMLEKAIDKFQKWFSGGIKAGDATKILSAYVDGLDEHIEELMGENVGDYFKGAKNEADAFNEKIKLLGDQISILIVDLQKLDGVEIKKFDASSTLAAIGVNNIEEAKMRFRDLAETIEEIEKKVKDSSLPDWIGNLFSGINGKKRELKELGTVILSDFIARSQEAIMKAKEDIDTFGNVTDKTATKINLLKRELDRGVTRGILDNIEIFCENSEGYKKAIDSIRGALNNLSSSLSIVDPAKKMQYEIDAMADSEEKIRKQNELNRKKEMESVGFNPEYTDVINKKYKTELEKSLEAFRKTKKQELDQKKKEERTVQNEIDDYKLQLMREGLEKEMQALKNERNQKLQEIKDSGIRVAERSGLVEQLYDKKVLELNRDWAYEMETTYQDMYNKIIDIQRESLEKIQNSDMSNLEMSRVNEKNNAWMGIINIDNPTNLSDRNIYYKELLDIDTEAAAKESELRKKALDDEFKYNMEEEKLRNERVADAKTVNLIMQELMKAPNPDELDYSQIEKNIQGELSNMKGELVDAYNEGKLDFKNFIKLIKQEQVAFNDNMNALQEEYNTESNKIVQDGLDKKTSAYNTYYTNLLTSVRTMQDEVSRQMQKTPIKDDSWGVVNISKTKEQYSTAIDIYKNISVDIRKIQENLKNDLQKGNINEEDFFMKYNELESMKKSIDDATKDIAEKQKMLLADFIQSIQKYIQAVANSFNQIMGAIWDAQGIAFDKEQESLDKATEVLEKKLDEQEQLLDKHKSTVESIEDELATARGSRRQHLIDQLNEEMAAQRAAAKQEQKLQKEKEAMQKKQDALELKRKKAQYKRDMTQAIVNGAMAVTYAAMNAYPIPAIPMMALAAASTAAQIAIMASNKPYAKGGQLDGGVAVGKRHKDGGIPVLGGKASIEGGEFITNRQTTAKNVDVLDFINSKHKKLTLDDFVDFYGGNKVRNSIISSTPKRVFEDGGVIPTLRTDYNIDDRLLSAIEYYNNRPVVVSVVDINNKQADVRRVQTLAGL